MGKIGTYIGRVAVRCSSNFNITARNGKVQGISYHYCTQQHQSDGYSYLEGEGVQTGFSELEVQPLPVETGSIHASFL